MHTGDTDAAVVTAFTEDWTSGLGLPYRSTNRADLDHEHHNRSRSQAQSREEQDDEVGGGGGWRPWTVDGRQQMGGYVTRYQTGSVKGSFDFATVRGAGHKVRPNNTCMACTG